MYRVTIRDARPCVIDQSGDPVPNSAVVEIAFPKQRISGPNGDIWILGGPAIAEIIVSGERYSDISVV